LRYFSDAECERKREAMRGNGGEKEVYFFFFFFSFVVYQAAIARAAAVAVLHVGQCCATLLLLGF
jgi:hypothetical protein